MINGYVGGLITALCIWGMVFLVARYFEQRGDRKRIEHLARWYIKIGSPTNDQEASEGFFNLRVNGMSPFPNDEILAYGQLTRRNASEKEIVEALRPLWRERTKACGGNFYLLNASRYGGNDIHDFP